MVTQKNESKNTREKRKDQNALYSLQEIMLAAQQFYESKYETKISLDKIRTLYVFLFEAIMLSIAKNARIDIYRFGAFVKKDISGTKLPLVHINTNAYRPAFSSVYFRMSQRFKDIVNGRPVEDNCYLYKESKKGSSAESSPEYKDNISPTSTSEE